MNNIYAILEELRSNNSRLFKEGVLKREIGNELFKRVAVLAYDPHTQFYIRKIPEYTPTPSAARPHSLEGALNSLSVLSNREKTGHAAIEHLRVILSGLTAEDAHVIELIIAKDLKCGASESTINKTWPGLISEFPVMLASKYEKKLVDKIFDRSGKAIVQLKSDGLRAAAIVENGKVSYRSRNGKPIDILGALDEDILKVAAGGDNWVIDGEMLVVDENGKILPRKIANGILNKANKGTISEEEAARVVIMVWDIIPLICFHEGVWNKAYEDRLAILKQRIEEAGTNKVTLIHSQEVDDLESAQQIFREMLSAGEEGIILKDPESPWEDKRSKGLVKFKAELTIEMRVRSIIEGTGKYVGKVGSLQCYTDDDRISSGVGTGLTDEDREKPFDYYLGKIVTIKYNEQITDANGNLSLFLPVYEEVRFDKDKTD